MKVIELLLWLLVHNRHRIRKGAKKQLSLSPSRFKTLPRTIHLDPKLSSITKTFRTLLAHSTQSRTASSCPAKTTSRASRNSHRKKSTRSKYLSLLSTAFGLHSLPEMIKTFSQVSPYTTDIRAPPINNHRR